MAPELTGGCACGAVRYRASGPLGEALWCHCRICQRVSGSHGIAFATVARDRYTIERGDERIVVRASSALAERWHCRDCGTPLGMRYRAQPDVFDLTLATLDEPGAISPRFHIFCAQAPNWAPLDDGLPRYDRWRKGPPGS